MVDESLISTNRLEGSLSETSLERLLEACHRHLLTGLIRIEAQGRSGEVQLSAGAVDEARWDGRSGQGALTTMGGLRTGRYELIQRLPDLSGVLGSAAALEGDLATVPLVAIMRHCEENALSCMLIVISGFERGEIHYRAGEIVDVMLNGRRTDDAIVTIAKMHKGRFRVAAPPLDLNIAGWPALQSEPSTPFLVIAAPRRGASAAGPARAPAETTEPVRERSRWRRPLGLLAVASALGVGTCLVLHYRFPGTTAALSSWLGHLLHLGGR